MTIPKFKDDLILQTTVIGGGVICMMAYTSNIYVPITVICLQLQREIER